MANFTFFDTFKSIIILWTSICLQDAQAIRKPFEVVKRCPFNESEWKVRAAHTACNGSESYHCLLTEGGVSLREQCTETSLFTSGFCPIFTSEGYLQWSPCKDTACPTSSYRSDEVYQYQICYRKTDYPKEEYKEQGSNDEGSVIGETTITVIGLVSLFFIVVVVLVVFYKKTQFGCKERVQLCFTDLRQRFQQSDRTENHQVSDAEKNEKEVLLHNDDTKKGASFDDLNNGANSDQPIYAQPEKTKTRKDPVKPEKAKTKKQMIANTTDTCDRKEDGPRGKLDDRDQKVKKLEELLKYLVHILERELSVNDLKEKMVIHSKSIEQYFSEPLIKELQIVKNPGDYSRLNVSSVFTLLCNFCDGITPSSRGWDYAPPDNETHVGADLERIRFMWNKYCDDDFEFKHLDEVYHRMKQKYGTVSVYGDDGVSKSPLVDEKKAEGFETVKLKIQSYKLNKDCSVEKGIVITEGTTSALKIMNSKNVVILKGAIGCGKTHALMAIQNHFQEKQWETEWVEFQNVKEKASKEKPTILLCDNLFGRFGSCVFSQVAVDEIEEILKTIENSKGNIKTVIGVHTHIFDEVKKDLKLSFLQQKNITVEMDKLSAAETLLIYKEQLKKGHCKTDSNCWFKTVGFQSMLDRLSKNQGQIGSPFLSLVYCNQHELFSDEAFSVNPIQTMMQHFQRMRHDSPTLYHCLVYLMCVQEHICEENPQEWAAHISADITKDSFKIAAASGYVKIDNNKATLAHDILTDVLFKSVAETEKCLLPAVQNSEVDMMLQLFRPPDTTHSDLYCDFMDVNKDETLRSIGQEFVYRYASKYQKQWKDHPLLTIDFVKDIYSSYLKALPKHMKKSK